jgi:hypothetical protein
MDLGPRTSSTLLIGALSVGVARPSSAAEQSCETLSVEADRQLELHHPELAERVRRVFTQRLDVEPCARVSLRLRQTSIEVVVALADGRSALRSLERSEDVVPTLEALLLVPEASKAKSEPARKVSPPAPPKSRRRPAVLRPARTPEGARGTPVELDDVPGRPLRIELSGALGVRAGDGKIGVGFGLISLLEASSWLVGFQGRVEQYQDSFDGVGALELGLLSGKRVDLDPVALDFVMGPMFAFQGTSMQSDVAHVEGQDTGRHVETIESGIEPRAFFGTRLSFAPRSTFHAFVALDGDVALTTKDEQPGLPVLPAWTLGLSIGSTVGTR